MDEYDVVEAGTDLLLGDSKSVLKKIGLSIFEKKQFEAIFVSAGKTVAEYEKDNTEQNEIRKILFCEKNMRLLANEISKKNSFDWLKDLDRCVDNLLSTSELDSINKDRCKKHFEDIVIYEVKKLFPQRYGSYCLGDIHDNVNSLMASAKYGNEMLYKIAELMKQYNDADKQQNKTTHEDWQDKSSYTLHKWHLERVEVDGIFAHKDSYTDDIIKLTETWQGIVVDTYNSIVDKMKNKYSQQEETSASVIFMGDSTNEKHDIKNSPYWKNLYGRDLEDTEIKGIFQDMYDEDIEIYLKGSIFLQEAYKEDYSVETLEKLVFPWVRSDWGDFSDLHNFVIEKKNIGLSSRVQYNDRHDIAYLKIFQNVENAFAVEQPHQIPDIWILNFVKKNEKYGWRIYGIGDKIADYKESGSILDWFEHIKEDK